MWISSSVGAAGTRALGRAVGRTAQGGLCVALIGDLGAGKTELARGVGEGLDVASSVTSPTFVLVAEHDGRLPLLHADLYRLDAADLPGVGLEEQLEDWPGVALVEWADRFPALLPADHLVIRIGIEEGDGRRFELEARGPGARAVLDRLRAQHGTGLG